MGPVDDPPDQSQVEAFDAVARTVPHRFSDVTERLSVLVFFAPAESA